MEINSVEAFALVTPGDILIPLQVACTPFVGIPVTGTSLPSIVMTANSIPYGDMGGGVRPEPTHRTDLAWSPLTLPVLIGQFMAAAETAGWDVVKLATDINGVNATYAEIWARSRRTYPFPFGHRMS